MPHGVSPSPAFSGHTRRSLHGSPPPPLLGARLWVTQRPIQKRASRQACPALRRSPASLSFPRSWRPSPAPTLVPPPKRLPRKVKPRTREPARRSARDAVPSSRGLSPRHSAQRHPLPPWPGASPLCPISVSPSAPPASQLNPFTRTGGQARG